MSMTSNEIIFAPWIWVAAGAVVLILVFLVIRNVTTRRNPIALIVATLIIVSAGAVVVISGPEIVARLKLDPAAVIEAPLRHPGLRNSLQFHSSDVVDGKLVQQDYVTIVATRTIYGHGGFGILEIGDVRIALRGREVTRSDTAPLTVGSNIPPSIHSSSGSTNASVEDLGFQANWSNGVTRCRFADEIEFEIRDSTIHLGGRAIPIGQGKKVVFYDNGVTRYVEEAR